MRQALLGLTLGALFAGVAVPQAATADSISFEAIDLPDTVVGEDLWQYDYRVSDFLHSENTAFEILFDPALYAGLQDPAPFVNADWDIVTLQPDPSLPDAGRYSALALVNDASVANPFPVSFVWLGGPGVAPGAQLFEISEFDDEGNFLGTLDSGETFPVPEPHALAGVGIGCLAARFLRSCRRERRS